jgi:hypothetical protein
MDPIYIDIENGTGNILQDASDTSFIGNKQQPYNFYLLNNANYNFIFECTPLDVSSNYNITPRFIDYMENYTIGFTDVSATATLDIDASMVNNLFLFQQRTITLADISLSDLEQLVYGVNKSIFNLNFSKAQVKRVYGTTITYINLEDDYIESIAETITNSVSITPQSLITNIIQLRNGVAALDAGFCIKMNTDISNNYYDLSLNGTPKKLNVNKTPNDMDKACKNLIAGLLTYTTPERVNQFFDDLKDQSPPYRFIFHYGDIIAVKITYKPQFTVAKLSSQGFYTFNPRSYKIFLRVV